MKKDLMLARKRVLSSYHVNGMPKFVKRPRNALYLSAANSWKHECMKCKVAFDLRKNGEEFISEAVDNSSGLRRDIVSLDSGLVYEVETDKRRAARFKGDVNVVVVMVD